HVASSTCRRGYMKGLFSPRWIMLAMLGALFIGIAVVAYDMPWDARRVFGACLAAAGVLNILLGPRTARRIFRSTRSKIWLFFGEEGVRFSYLSLGGALVVAGLLLLLLPERVAHAFFLFFVLT